MKDNNMTTTLLVVLLIAAFMMGAVAAASPAVASFGTSSDFNFVAAGDWGCTPNTINTVRKIVNKDPELVLGLGDYSYYNGSSMDIWRQMTLSVEDGINFLSKIVGPGSIAEMLFASKFAIQDGINFLSKIVGQGEEVGQGEDCWLRIVAPIDEKMKIAIGNQDDITPTMISQYKTHFNVTQQFYSFNYQNVHFIVMSTELRVGEGSEQYNFVKNDLAAAASDPNIDWIVVYFHELAYISPSAIADGIHDVVRDTYHPLFDQYDVDLVLQAHHHAYERSYPIKYNNNTANSTQPLVTTDNASEYKDPEGQIFATVGTGGHSLHNFWGKAYYIKEQYVGFGFLNVDVIHNGSRFVATFYANDGTIKDRFIIDKSLSAS
jgi:hypothetical protein